MFAAATPLVDFLQLAQSAQTVNFFDNGSPISGCQALPLDSNGRATCNVVVTPGDHVYTATYGGKQVVAQNGSSGAVVAVVPTPEETGTVVGGFLSDRANQIVSNQFDGGRQIDRLNQAQQNQNQQGQTHSGGGAYLADSKVDLPPVETASRLGAGPTGSSITATALGAGAGDLRPSITDDPDMMSLQSFLYNYLRTAGESGNFGQFSLSGPLDVKANFGGDSKNGSFKTSLSQMMNWQTAREQRERASLGLGHSGGGGGAYLPFDIWAEGNYASYSGARNGSFGMVTLGADYVINPSFLIGAYGQFDMIEQSSGTEVSGKGWMAGPYATARLGDNVFWQARAGWGMSDNEITMSPAGTDSFDSTRWLVSSSLSGRWSVGGLAFSPTASFSYFHDTSESYVDQLGFTVPEATTRLGQLNLSPEISYGFATEDGWWIEPSLATELIWNFASTNVDGTGSLNGSATGLDGVRGRVKTGINVKTPAGVAIGLTGSYDGIGADDYSSFSGQATVSMPLN